MEALWMLYAPDSKTVRLVVDRVLDKEEIERQAKRREKTLKTLSRADQIRCQALMTKKFEIAKLAADNPTFGTELLSGEISKLDRLVDSAHGRLEGPARARRRDQCLGRYAAGEGALAPNRPGLHQQRPRPAPDRRAGRAHATGPAADDDQVVVRAHAEVDLPCFGGPGVRSAACS